jgi:hypothetical protein
MKYSLHCLISFLPLFYFNCQHRNSILSCRDVFTAPLRSKESGADHRKHRSSIVVHVRFRGNMFTEPLHSNELFRLSGVMLLYVYICLYDRYARMNLYTCASVCEYVYGTMYIYGNMHYVCICSHKYIRTDGTDRQDSRSARTHFRPRLLISFDETR